MQVEYEGFGFICLLPFCSQQSILGSESYFQW